MNCLKNKILKIITTIAAINIVFFGSALDSESLIPLVICVVSMLWIGLFVHANKDYIERKAYE